MSSVFSVAISHVFSFILPLADCQPVFRALCFFLCYDRGMIVKAKNTRTRALAEARRLMVERGITVTQLARMLNISEGRTRGVIHGHDTPGFALAGLIADALGFDPGDWHRESDIDPSSIKVPRGGKGRRPGPGRGHKGPIDPARSGLAMVRERGEAVREEYAALDRAAEEAKKAKKGEEGGTTREPRRRRTARRTEEDRT